MRAIVLTLFVVLVGSASNVIAQERIKIGVSIPLTGPVADYGIAIANGMKLAIEEVDTLHRIELKFEDNQYEAKAALAAYNNLKKSGVDALYLWGAMPLEITAAIAEKDKIPTIGATGKPVTLKDKKYLVNYMAGPEKFISVLLKNPRISNARNVALVSNDTPYTSGLRAAFKSNFDSSKIVMDETTDHGTLDYRALALRVKNIGAEVLGLMLLEPDLTIFCKALKEMHYHPFVFGSDQFESESSIKNCSPLLDNAVFANHSQSDYFVNKYKAAYGDNVQIADASAGYAVIEIFNHVLSESKDPQKVMEALRTLKNFKTAKGIVSSQSKDGVFYFDWDVVQKEIRAN